MYGGVVETLEPFTVTEAMMYPFWAEKLNDCELPSSRFTKPLGVIEECASAEAVIVYVTAELAICGVNIEKAPKTNAATRDKQRKTCFLTNFQSANVGTIRTEPFLGFREKIP